MLLLMQTIEAFRHKNRKVWGIVWHPERMEKAVLPNDLRSFIQ
jgi:gamma-glutamyl-gamma-aminobutyrate hydrolase PuuD